MKVYLMKYSPAETVTSGVSFLKSLVMNVTDGPEYHLWVTRLGYSCGSKPATASEHRLQREALQQQRQRPGTEAQDLGKS